jgi:hypothetical protein
LPPQPVAPPTPAPKPKDPIVVHTGTFGSAELKPTLKKPVEQVQTGGFGSPEGFRGKA